MELAHEIGLYILGALSFLSALCSPAITRLIEKMKENKEAMAILEDIKKEWEYEVKRWKDKDEDKITNCVTNEDRAYNATIDKQKEVIKNKMNTLARAYNQKLVDLKPHLSKANKEKLDLLEVRE